MKMMEKVKLFLRAGKRLDADIAPVGSDEMDLSGYRRVVMSPGNPAEMVALAEDRWRFAANYCRDKGWDINDLTMEQLFEIRRQPGWQAPK